MQHLATNTFSPSPWWGKEEQTAFVYIPLMIGTEVSHNYGIPTSVDTPASSVQANGNGNMSPTLASCKS